jgi:hypothetical protein
VICRSRVVGDVGLVPAEVGLQRLGRVTLRNGNKLAYDRLVMA